MNNLKDIDKNVTTVGVEQTIRQEHIKSSSSNKLKKFLEKVFEISFQSRVFILLIGIILLLKTILLYKVGIFINKPLEFKDIYMAMSFISIFLTIPMLLKEKPRFYVTLIIDLSISILLLINELYFSYSSNLVSVSQILNLQYGKEISAGLRSIVHIRQILYILDIIIILIVYRVKRKSVNKKIKFYYTPGIIYAISMIFLVNFINNNWFKEAETHQYNKILQIESSSIYGYHFLDIKNNFNMKKNVKYKTKNEMLEVYNQLMNKYDEKYQLEYNFAEIAKDKNVIIVQLESIQNFVVNRTINGREITPNLNRFLRENIEFTNVQNQSYTTTADSEHTVMNSLYPLENGMSFAQYSANDYSDMYNNFKDGGYTTTYIHGNEGGFWNRKAVYSRLNIDNLYFDDVFDKDTERINGYISDEQVYRKIANEIKNYDNKFFVNIVAASSHTAFDLPGIENKENKVNIDVGDEYRGMYFGNYLESVNYADYAFGIFMDELKNSGLYDDTVILVYGDHAGLQMYNWEMQDFIREINPSLNDIQTQINYTNILCGLKIPGIDSIQIDKPISKLDLKPTLMEICGINDSFSLGRSMFSDKDFACINNGKIITDKYFYDGEWYFIESGEKLELGKLSNDVVDELNYYCDCLQTELDISLSVNILNLLKK